MRVSAISSYYSCIHSSARKTVSKQIQGENLSTKEINFKGWKAGLGGVLGTGLGVVLGIGITAITGGAAAPFVAGIIGCAGGAITGSVAENKDNDDEQSHDSDTNYRNI